MPHVWTGFGASGREHPEGYGSGVTEGVPYNSVAHEAAYNAAVQAGMQPFGVNETSPWVGSSPDATPYTRPSYGVNPNAGGNRFAYGRPTFVGPIEDYTTAGEDWARFMSSQQPFWSTRAPLADIGQNLRARYLMAAPYMAQSGTAPTFSQYLSDYTPQGRFGPYEAQDYGTLRKRAEEASRAAIEPTEQYLADETLSQEEWNRRAWLASYFGPDAEGAQANQLAVANLLALQREGQGTPFRGRFADAIRGAMSNVYQQRLNVGAPRESFLDWYLQQSRAR